MGAEERMREHGLSRKAIQADQIQRREEVSLAEKRGKTPRLETAGVRKAWWLPRGGEESVWEGKALRGFSVFK